MKTNESPTNAAGGDNTFCRTCGVMMTEHESLQRNCGGDCLMCMANAGDPDCIEAASRIVGVTTSNTR